MSIIINILIVFFGLLILYQINLAVFKIGIIEGLENNSNTKYKEYDMNNPNNAMILAQQNAGNIEYLKSQIDLVLDFRGKINNIDTRINDLSKQVDDLVLAQKTYASETFPSEPPVVTGAVEEEEEEVVMM